MCLSSWEFYTAGLTVRRLCGGICRPESWRPLREWSMDWGSKPLLWMCLWPESWAPCVKVWDLWPTMRRAPKGSAAGLSAGVMNQSPLSPSHAGFMRVKPSLSLFAGFRARCRSLWTTCSRPSSARPTGAALCRSPSSTCLTSWTSRLTSIPSPTTTSGTPGRATGTYT